MLDALDRARRARVPRGRRHRDLRRGGEICYVGAERAGGSASSTPPNAPTFGVEPEVVQAIIAGGEAAIAGAVEHAEDDPAAGAAEVSAAPWDGEISSSGSRRAGRRPSSTARSTAPGSRRPHGAHRLRPAGQAPDDHPLGARLLVGPEVLAGSSRLKAGTATKLALNAISTLAMARAGKTYRGHMVDVNTRANAKLVGAASASSPASARSSSPRRRLLETTGGAPRRPSSWPGAARTRGARALLDDANGFLAEVWTDESAPHPHGRPRPALIMFFTWAWRCIAPSARPSRTQAHRDELENQGTGTATDPGLGLGAASAASGRGSGRTPSRRPGPDRSCGCRRGSAHDPVEVLRLLGDARRGTCPSSRGASNSIFGKWRQSAAVSLTSESYCSA